MIHQHGPVRLSGAIMAHEGRRRWAEALADQTGLPIVWDQIGSVWETAQRAWRAHDHDATHHLVLQDDAILSRDFLPAAARFIAHLDPREPASFIVLDYRLHNSRTDYEAHMARGARIWRSFNSVSAIALALPVADIEPALAFGDTMPRVTHDDFKIREYYKRQRQIKFAFPIPSLVQHRDRDENPSLLPGHDDKHPDRTSHQFIGEDRSGLDIDWHKPAEAPMTSKAIYANLRTNERVTVDANSKAALHLEKHPRWVRVGNAPVVAADEPKPEPPPLIAPPKVGVGSTRAAWLAYAHTLGLQVDSDMTKAQIIEACDAHTDQQD